MGTTKSVARVEVIAMFDGKLSSDDKLLDCGENTYIELRPSDKYDFIYPVLLLSLNVSDGKFNWNIEVLRKFYHLCKHNQMQMRSLRNDISLSSI